MNTKLKMCTTIEATIIHLHHDQHIILCYLSCYLKHDTFNTAYAMNSTAL